MPRSAPSEVNGSGNWARFGQEVEQLLLAGDARLKNEFLLGASAYCRSGPLGKRRNQFPPRPSP